MDTSPMVQGTDTLTDCLNGTLVTMNGNEVILQNDMGNRRVDNAFLPPGYQPVGMKEYGGVIYVAAYNPITNKSQIGSFPSPERKIDNLDDPSLSNSFDFGRFLEYDSDSQLNLKVLKSDTFMIPLTGDISLRAGDKFAIYSSDLYNGNLKNDITNFNNISNGKVKSPKNKKYTLSIGILNSQNEFVDITKTLCRWNNNQIIEYNDDKSELYKFNDGYFISSEFDNSDFWESIRDSELIKHRQKMATNTYAYKLIGPMYLKVILNHIENFNYNIYGLKENNKTTIWVEGYLTYNCPDGANSSDGNNIYESLDENYPNSNEFNGFDFIVENLNNTVISTKYEKCFYNSATNLYSVKIVKEYELNQTTETINYVIGVDSELKNNGQKIYIKGLSAKGTLNLDLLGSGKVFIDGWRFYNNIKNTSTTLTFSFNAYPKYGESFSDLKFNFENIEDSNDTVDYPKEGGLPLYNGRQTYNINWGGYLQPRKVYKVTASYNSSLSGIKTVEEEGEDRWFITTELFNDFYTSSSGITDFCNTDNEEFLNKMLVSLYSDGEVENNSKVKPDKFEGELISNSNDISYICQHGYDINLTDLSRLYIENEELYPDFIQFEEGEENSIDIKEIKISKVGNIEIELQDNEGDYSQQFIDSLSINYGQMYNSSDIDSAFDQEKALEVSTNIESGRKTVSGSIFYEDIYKGYSQENIKNITNGFDVLSNILLEASPLHHTPGSSVLNCSCGGIITNYDEEGGYNDWHYIDVIRKSDTFRRESLPPNSDLGEGFQRVYKFQNKGGSIGPHKISFSTISSELYEALNNSTTSPSQMFQFIFQGDPTPKMQFFSKVDKVDWDDDYASGNNEYKLGGYNTRLWWRSTRGEWATFDELFNSTALTDSLNIQDDLVNHIKNNLKHDYIYCMYNNYYSNNLNLYATDDNYKYTNEYSIPLTFTISYELSDGKSIDDIVENLDVTTNKDIGNLKFREAENLNIITNNVIVFTLKSSKKFHDTINKFDKSSVSGVEINTGLMKDVNGDKLDPQYLYYEEDGQLIKVSHHYFKVDFENLIDGKNTLIYNRQNYKTPQFSYQIAAETGNSTTVLHYNNVNVISDD